MPPFAASEIGSRGCSMRVLRSLVLWPHAHTARPAYDPVICRVRAGLHRRETGREKIDPPPGVTMEPGMGLLGKTGFPALAASRTSELDVPLIARHSPNVTLLRADHNGH